MAKGVVVKLVLLWATLVPASVHAGPGSCPEYRAYVPAVVIGGAAGAAAGIGAAVIVAGAVATVTTTATATGSVGLAIAVDCATTGCIGTVVTGILMGVGAAIYWFTGDRDCAGALVLTDEGRWWRWRNYDSVKTLAVDLQKRYGEELERARLVSVFRHCAAAAVAGSTVVVGEAKTKSGARNEAMRACRQQQIGACRVATAECNAG